MRSELTASIYDKALKRKDFSGVVSKDAKKDALPAEGASKTQTKGNTKLFSIESYSTDGYPYSPS